MRVGDTTFRTIWVADDGRTVEIIDQTRLPHAFEVVALRCLADAAHAIRAMQVRGAPLIGVTAAYGLSLAIRDDPSDAGLAQARETLLATRPTAVNLRWALDAMHDRLAPLGPGERAATALRLAGELADEDVTLCRAIGEHGAAVLEAAKPRDGERLQILTHCNAGWLATVDWGTALAPIYVAHERGLPLHVWVDETRPRNQGASLTAWELLEHGIPHTVIADNAGGHLMQTGRVDLCITGSDRTAANGDVCNKVGTYLKALAAHDNDVPFYVALPHSTIDWRLDSGREIPIEERSSDEVSRIWGRTDAGETLAVSILPAGSPAANPGLRRDARAFRHGSRDRARRVRCVGRGSADVVPRTAPARRRLDSVGNLYIVATPIGNLEDVTLRALRVLREASLVLAEDTRRTRVLLDRHGVAAKPVSLHAHNESARAERVLDMLGEGGDVALVSDAGTPLVSDPGERLVAAVVDAGFPVVAVPGASAVLTALASAGLPAERWSFVGFLPRRAGDRRKCLESLVGRSETLIFFESPRRVGDTLQELAAVFGARRACVARELTKLHEELARDTLDRLAERFAEGARGEVTILVAGAPESTGEAPSEIVDLAIRARLPAGGPASEIARDVAKAVGVPRRDVYARVLALRGDA